MALVAILGPVLADPDLLAEDVADNARRHLRPRRERPGAVAADEQHARLEGLALVRADAVDEQPLALADDVLLPAHGDDRVAVGLRGHSVENAGVGPASRASLAEIQSPEPISSPHSDIGT